jgi:hypothetical protein
VTTTEYNQIEDLETLFNIQKEINTDVGSRHHAEGYEKWRFVLRWNSYNEQEKLRWYDKEASHELNLFIYFKDR